MSAAYPVDALPPRLQKLARERLEKTLPRLPDPPLPDPPLPPGVSSTAAAAPNPFRCITLPWSVLVADNRKYAPALKGAKPVIILTTEYREAKARAARIATEQLAGLPPLEGELEFAAAMFEPNRHARDIQNYSKLVCDALKGIAYRDDRQLRRAEWHCRAVDIDRPRLEIVMRRAV